MFVSPISFAYQMLCMDSRILYDGAFPADPCKRFDMQK